MKIVGYTDYGYLIDASPTELATVSGQSKHDSHQSRARYSRAGDSYLPIGTEIAVNGAWKNLELVMKTSERRKHAAELLRSAATLLENGVPDPLLIPEETVSHAQNNDAVAS